MNNQDTDFKWFLENYMRIFEESGECWVVIKDKKILGTYPDFKTALSSTCETEELGTFIVQHCNGKESGYTEYIDSAS